MTNDEGYHSLTANEVAEVLESGAEVFLIDIRPPRQFHQGHLPEAISLPAEDFADRYEREINPDDSVILICEKGLNSIAAAKFLISQDFTNVALLAGGMIAWREMQGESD